MKFTIVIFEIICLLLINYSESRVVKRSAQFNNDDSTSVGQQIGPDTAFNNAPGGNYWVPIYSCFIIMVSIFCI